MSVCFQESEKLNRNIFQCINYVEMHFLYRMFILEEERWEVSQSIFIPEKGIEKKIQSQNKTNDHYGWIFFPG